MNRNNSAIKPLFTAILLIVLTSGFFACTKYQYTLPAVDPAATWHLQTDIQPIFTANCTACHGNAITPDLREGKSYQALTKAGYVTLPAESSKLYLKMTSSSHISRSTETERLKVLYWITQGAKNN